MAQQIISRTLRMRRSVECGQLSLASAMAQLYGVSWQWRFAPELRSSRAPEALAWHWMGNRHWNEVGEAIAWDANYSVALDNWTGFTANYARRLLNRYCRDYRANPVSFRNALDEVLSEAGFLFHRGYPLRLAVFMAARRQIRRDGKLKLATDVASGDKMLSGSITDILDARRSVVNEGITFADCALDFGDLFRATETERAQYKVGSRARDMAKSRRRGKVNSYLYASDERIIVRKAPGGKAKIRSKRKSAGTEATIGLRVNGGLTCRGASGHTTKAPSASLATIAYPCNSPEMRKESASSDTYATKNRTEQFYHRMGLIRQGISPLFSDAEISLSTLFASPLVAKQGKPLPKQEEGECEVTLTCKADSYASVNWDCKHGIRGDTCSHCNQ